MDAASVRLAARPPSWAMLDFHRSDTFAVAAARLQRALGADASLRAAAAASGDRLRFVDLCCGIGGFHAGFMAGAPTQFACVAAADVDGGARTLYAANYEVAAMFGDLATIDPLTLPRVDLLCAGFPCQPFSRASADAKGFADPKSGGVFGEIVRIATVVKPRFLLLENVPGIINHDEGKTLTHIFAALGDLGYTVRAAELNAAYFGSPQARHRVFFSATLGEPFEFVSPPLTEPVPVRSIIDWSVTAEANLGNQVVVADREVPPLEPFKPRTLSLLRDTVTGRESGQGQRIYDIDSVGVTVTRLPFSNGMPLYRVGDAIRRLSHVENQRMMGIPDDFNWLDATVKQRNEYCGNSVVVNVIQHLAPLIAAHLRR